MCVKNILWQLSHKAVFKERERESKRERERIKGKDPSLKFHNETRLEMQFDAEAQKKLDKYFVTVISMQLQLF